MDKREFLKTSLLGAAAIAASPSIVSSCTPPKKGADTPLRLSFQEKNAVGGSLNEKFDYMESLGVTGFEPHGKKLLERMPEIKEALKGRDIVVSAICAGFKGFILAEDPAEKALFDKTMRELVCAAGELGSTGVIMVPAFNRQKPCLPDTNETWDYLCNEMRLLGDFALEHGTTVILEPLNRKEAWFLRYVAEAAAICRESGSKGVKCLGDFWHMKEEPSDYAAFLAAGEYLRHVHIASRGRRKTPGEDGALDNYIDGFRALKEMEYPYYVSFECGSAGPVEQTTPQAVALLREQWAEA